MSEAVKPVDDTADSLAIENAIFDAALQLTDPPQRAEFPEGMFAEGAITFGASSEELKEIWVSTVPKIVSTT